MLGGWLEAELRAPCITTCLAALASLTVSAGFNLALAVDRVLLIATPTLYFRWLWLLLYGLALSVWPTWIVVWTLALT